MADQVKYMKKNRENIRRVSEIHTLMFSVERYIETGKYEEAQELTEYIIKELSKAELDAMLLELYLKGAINESKAQGD